MPSRFRRFITSVSGAAMCALMLLLPLKFGGLAVMPESGGFYPEALFDWLFISFPPHALGMIGAVILIPLLLTLGNIPRKQQLFLLVWTVLPTAAALPGAIHGMPDDTLAELSNLAGIGACIAAGTLLIAENRAWSNRFAAAFCCGGLLCAGCGIHQYFFGLDELREFAAEQSRLGVNISPAMKLKLTDPRIFSTMASSNTLASLLMMITPLTIYFAIHWSKFFEPVKVSRIVFIAVMTGVTSTALAMTASRSALFCPAAAVLLAALSHRKLHRNIRLAIFAAVLIVISGGLFFAIHYGRGTASMAERADYLRTSVLLTLRHPAAGSGWGGFFRHHMTWKISDTDESARDPHNIAAAFASQAGIIPGIIILVVLIMPLAWLWKERFTPGLPMAAFWSGVLFTIHSLLDCDWHVPALPAAMGILYAAALSANSGKSAASDSEPRRFIAIRTVLAVLAAAAFAGNYRYLQGDAALSRLQEKLYPTSSANISGVAHLPVPVLIKELRACRPDSQLSWQLEGDWHWQCQNREKAESCYLQAVSLDPLRPGIWAKLARLQMQRGNRETAIKSMQKAHELFPKNPRYDVKKFIAGEI